MSQTTIEWATHSWNPFTWNCNLVSPGCKHCYARERAAKYHGRNSQGGVFDGVPTWRESSMRELMSKRQIPPGSVIFVNSHSDTYHEGAKLRYIHAVHNAAAYLRPDVTFLLLTKRPERALALSPYLIWPQNLWIGTSVENADYLWRLDYLLEIPAAGHFVSAEPLLGSLAQCESPGDRYRGIERYLYIDIKASQFLPNVSVLDLAEGRRTLKAARLRNHRLGWVIVGGESGAERRPFDKQWAAGIRDLCVAADVPFMFKQGSAYASGQDRLLDGREWNESPFHLAKHDPLPQRQTEPMQLKMF